MKQTASKHTILYVDDEEPIINSVKRLFRKEKFRLLTAYSGEEALTILEKTKVHLVISDQRMPEMSGTQFLAKVRENYPETIRIILTGYTEVDSMQQAINQGHIYKFLLKPWDGEDLKNEVRSCLERYDLIRSNFSMQVLLEKNHSLQMTESILYQLPTPVGCIDPDLRFSIVNKRAGALTINGKQPARGEPASDYFTAGDVERIESLFDDKNHQPLVLRRDIDGRTYDIQCSPMTGKFRHKGIIICFNPVL